MKSTVITERRPFDGELRYESIGKPMDLLETLNAIIDATFVKAPQQRKCK